MSRTFSYAFAGHVLIATAAFLMVVQTAAVYPFLVLSTSFKATILISTFVIYRLAYYGLKWPIRILYILSRKDVLLPLLLLMIFLPSLKTYEISGLLLMFVCCLAYFMETDGWKGLRSIPVVKSAWLALVWTITTVVIPIYNEYVNNQFLFIAERFFFLFAICIIYNLRDSTTDHANGIFTIIQRIGVSKSKQLSLLMLTLSALMVFFHHYPLHVSFALYISLAVTAVIILLAKESGHHLFYSLAVDASMILQSLLVIFTAT